MNLCDVSYIKSIMQEHGTDFKKYFGQNFLINPAIPEKIASLASDDSDCTVIEIGPGIGSLTYFLAKKYKNVVSFEIDEKLIPILNTTLSEFDNVEIINADIMKVDIAKFCRENIKTEKISVCANLPYYITTPIIMSLIESGINIQRIVVMIQKEVADRLCAKAGSADYGAITAVLEYYGVAKKCFAVSAGNFLPAPKVDSSVISIEPYQTPQIVCKSEKELMNIIKLAFLQRRKTLSNALSSAYQKSDITDALKELGFDENIRGERLSAKDFAALTDLLYEKKNRK